jgi:transcriptional regulator with XRE-family HTH domain
VTVGQTAPLPQPHGNRPTAARRNTLGNSGATRTHRVRTPYASGNGERHVLPGKRLYVRQNQAVDLISPRRPQDPPWRSRTAHRTSSLQAMEALRRGRQRRGWSMTAAAKHSGVSRPMISLLKRGLRRPSESVAEDLIDTYGLDAVDGVAVRAVALRLVGRDSPYKTGVHPERAAWETSWDTQGNGTPGYDGAGQHRTDAGTDGATGRPAATAEQWIEWARMKSEQAQGAPGTLTG